MYNQKMLIICLLFVWWVLSQDLSCTDLNVVCVGDDGEDTLTAAIDLVMYGSEIEYILLQRDVAASDTGERERLSINSTHAGTAEKPITIMPHPDVATIISIIVDGSNQPTASCGWIVFEKEYWKLYGGEDSLLKVIYPSSGGACQEGTGIFVIASGKVTVENVIFQSNYYDYSYSGLLSVVCMNGKDCDDENFDDVFITGCEFHSNGDGHGHALKIDITSASWTTKKVTMSGCTFGDETNSLRTGIRMSSYGDIYTTDLAQYKYGCQNCEFYDNEFINIQNPIAIDVGQDLSFHDNIFKMGSVIDYSVLRFYSYAFEREGSTSSLEEGQYVKNFLFYDNEIDYRGNDGGQGFIYLYDAVSIDNYVWIDNMVIRNNVITDLSVPLITWGGSMNLGSSITLEGNTVTTLNDSFAYDYNFSYDCSGSPDPMGGHSLMLLNNHIEWDLSERTSNSSWFFSERCALELDVGYNYFSLDPDSEFSVFVLEGTTGDDCFGNVVFYGNVIYHEKESVYFGLRNDVGSLSSLVCDSLEVTNNLFSTTFLYFDDAFVTWEDNEVSEDESAYDPDDPCETNYMVPYHENYTPETDINGDERESDPSEETWIGPVTCYSEPVVVFPGGSLVNTICSLLLLFLWLL